MAKGVLNLPESPKTKTFTLSREAISGDSRVPEVNSGTLPPANQSDWFRQITPSDREQIHSLHLMLFQIS